VTTSFTLTVSRLVFCVSIAPIVEDPLNMLLCATTQTISPRLNSAFGYKHVVLVYTHFLVIFFTQLPTYPEMAYSFLHEAVYETPDGFGSTLYDQDDQSNQQCSFYTNDEETHTDWQSDLPGLAVCATFVFKVPN